MKINFQFLLIALVLSLVSGVIAEEAAKQPSNTVAAAPKELTPEEATKKRTERRKEKAANLKEYQALPNEDPLIEVGSTNFLRKVASSGRGEFLDVQFNITNKDFRTKEYSVYVLAVNEGTTPISYESKWRPNDPQSKIKVVRYNALSPEILKEGTVLGDKVTKEAIEDTQNRILDGKLVRELTEPNLDDYIAYLIKNSDKALKIKLFGNESPAKEEYVSSNFQKDKAEIDRDVNFKAEEHTYTLQANKYITTVTTHHFSLYRPDYKFFNKIVILVFDNARPRNKLIYRSIQDIGKIKLKS